MSSLLRWIVGLLETPLPWQVTYGNILWCARRMGFSCFPPATTVGVSSSKEVVVLTLINWTLLLGGFYFFRDISVVPLCWKYILIYYTVCLVYVAIPLYYWLTAKTLYAIKCNENALLYIDSAIVRCCQYLVI